MTQEDEILAPCSDVHCILRDPHERNLVGTNGGCQHLKTRGPETNKLLKAMGSEISRLRRSPGIYVDGIACDSSETAIYLAVWAAVLPSCAVHKAAVDRVTGGEMGEGETMIRTLKDVKPTLKQYFALLDVLRARRGAPGWKAEQDRQILAQLDDWYMLLSQADQDEIESQGTRAWPETRPGDRADVPEVVEVAADHAAYAVRAWRLRQKL